MSQTPHPHPREMARWNPVSRKPLAPGTPALLHVLFRKTFVWILLLLGFSTLATSPAEPPDLFASGNANYATGNWSHALSDYQKLAASGPLSANLFLGIGDTHFQLGDLGLAALAFERALHLEPGHPEALTNLRTTLEKAGTPLPTHSSLRAGLRLLLQAVPKPLWPLLASGSFWLLLWAACGITRTSFTLRSPLLLFLLPAAALLLISSAVLVHLQSEK